MLINYLVLFFGLFFIIFNLFKILKLKSGEEKQIIISGFKQKFHKRYTYYIPLFKIDDIEQEWISNPKLEQSLLGKEVKVIFVNNNIFEKKDILKSYIFSFISFLFIAFAFFNLFIK